jgi:hypothetical protein
VLLTDDNSIYLYDLYEERQVRMHKLETLEPCTLDFIRQDSISELCAMFDSDLQPRKLETKEFWKRNVSAGFQLMVQLTNSLLLIDPSSAEVFGCRKYFKDMENNERVETVKVADKSLVVAFVRSPTKLTLKLRHDATTLEYLTP